MSDSCELPEFYAEQFIRRARKPHTCVECSRAIAPGTPYMKCTGKWEGELRTEVQHVHCYDFCRKVNLDVVGDCVLYFGGTSEQLHEALDDEGLNHHAKGWLMAEWDAICAQNFNRAKRCAARAEVALLAAGVKLDESRRTGKLYAHVQC